MNEGKIMLEMFDGEIKNLNYSLGWNLHGMSLKHELDETAQHELIDIYYQGK